MLAIDLASSRVTRLRATDRNQGIDLLRGLSILLVVLHHIGLRIPLRKTDSAEILPTRLLDALNYNGYEAVFVFFVISGFSDRRPMRCDDGAAWVGSSSRARSTRAASARIVPCLLALVAVC